MTFSESIKTCLTKKYFTIKGRATRAEYWWFQLFVHLLIFAPFLAIMPFVDVEESSGVVPIVIFVMLAMALLLCPNFCVKIRRLHDAGLSGWCLLVNLIPYVGGIILFVMTLMGSDKDNKWGPSPHSPSSKQSDETKDVIVTTNVDL